MKISLQRTFCRLFVVFIFKKSRLKNILIHIIFLEKGAKM
ncbi:hypothetical protein BAXH7_01469 [Bacillus amyloliquefaciens XH7]|nr:hypothetical protein BAMTA208_07225 [Bacillus amyloliquefaciens TA208]AEB63696.1 hypothetical protein LL3_02159 [Bacillus amyloliquefaciens LL3]AEK88607.1 hypothetical protein BAXH7_01469 [Bacillus amyloliquefaciens XH7]